MKTQKLLISLFALSIVLLCLAIFLLLRAPDGSHDTEKGDVDTLNTPSSLTTDTQHSPVSNATSSGLVGPSTDNTTSNPSLSKTCAEIEKEKITTQGGEYEKGTLIVSFSTNTSFSQALSIITEHGVSVASHTEAASSFSTSHWFVVSVPKGAEFEKKCLLSSDPRIKYVAINPIIQLNQ